MLVAISVCGCWKRPWFNWVVEVHCGEKEREDVYRYNTGRNVLRIMVLTSFVGNRNPGE